MITSQKKMTEKNFPPRGLRTWIFRALTGVIAAGIPYLLYISYGWDSYWYWYLLIAGPFFSIIFGDFAIFGYKDSFSERMQTLYKRVKNLKLFIKLRNNNDIS